jgi:hypothetical protein
MISINVDVRGKSAVGLLPALDAVFMPVYPSETASEGRNNQNVISLSRRWFIDFISNGQLARTRAVARVAPDEGRRGAHLQRPTLHTSFVVGCLCGNEPLQYYLSAMFTLFLGPPIRLPA